LAFLPIRRRVTLFLLVPGFVVTLLSTFYLPVVQIRFQYTTHFTPYVFLAAVLTLAWLLREEGAVRFGAALIALVAGTLLATNHFGALRQSHFFAGFGRVEFAMTDGDRARLANLEALAARVPPDASVAASDNEGPHLAERTRLFSLRHGVLDA